MNGHQKDAGLTILGLEAENLKRIKAVEIKPTAAGLVQITGANDQGKTSVLDSIWWALAGAKHIQAAPIRQGSDKARIKLDLGDLVVERRFGEGGSNLSVKTADGARYGSPQRVLDELLGAISFDPLAFANAEPKAQADMLRRTLGIDFADLDGQIKELYAERTEINSIAGRLKAQLDDLVIEGERVEAVDPGDLLDQLQAATRRSSEIAEAREIRRDLQARANIKKEEARRQAEIAREANERREAAAKEAAELEATFDQLPPDPEPIDVAPIRDKLDQAQDINRRAEQWKRRDELEAEHKREAAAGEDLTARIDKLRQAKKDRIAAADMPIEGLGFEADAVTYLGLPFDQASTAIQIRTSVALAMAANPRLRVIMIREGSLLDDGNLELIGKMAADAGYQIWIERVDTSGTVGFVIADGELASIDGKSPNQATLDLGPQQ